MIKAILLLTTIASSSTIFASSAQTYQQKVDDLWRHTSTSRYSGVLPTENPSMFDMLFKMLNPSYLIKTLNNKSDYMIRNRKKLIHTYGAVAKVQYVPVEQSKYHGIAKDGGVGLLRASVATFNMEKFTPGIALKFPVSFNKSVDIIAMNSVDGQGNNKNFFAKDFRTAIPDSNDPALKPLAKAFQLTAKIKGLMVGKKLNAQKLDIHTFGSISQSGRLAPIAAANIKLLRFEPSAQAAALISEDSQNDFREDLEAIAPGTVLYNVYATDLIGEANELVGHIELVENFVASQFGDETLHFGHELQAE